MSGYGMMSQILRASSVSGVAYVAVYSIRAAAPQHIAEIALVSQEHAQCTVDDISRNAAIVSASMEID